MDKFLTTLNPTALLSAFVKSFLAQAPKIILILILSWLAIRTIRMITGRIENAAHRETDILKRDALTKRAKTIASIINNSAKVLLSIISGMMILQELGIQIGPILASIGFVGLAFGFGAQSLVKDIVTGFFILLENQFAVGDVIKTNGVGGLVEDINLRVTTLRDIEGIVHYVPNGQISIVSNMTKEWSRAMLEVGVAYKENVDHVLKVMREICDEMRKDTTFGPLLIEDFEIPGVEKLDDSSVVIRVMVKTLPLKQWDVMREMRRRIKNRFDKDGIEIPFPQRTIHTIHTQN